jgi:hypothetical protein
MDAFPFFLHCRDELSWWIAAAGRRREGFTGWFLFGSCVEHKMTFNLFMREVFFWHPRGHPPSRQHHAHQQQRSISTGCRYAPQ